MLTYSESQEGHFSIAASATFNLSACTNNLREDFGTMMRVHLGSKTFFKALDYIKNLIEFSISRHGLHKIFAFVTMYQNCKRECLMFVISTLNLIESM